YKWNRRADDLQYRIAEKEYVEEMEDIAINITSDFFELYLAQMNVENASFNVSINDSIYTISQGRYKVGKIAENDLLQSELQLLGAQTQLANAKLEYERTAQQLKTSLGLPAQIKIEITPPAEAPQISVDPAMALEQANQNRSDLLSYDLQQTNAERDLAQAKSDAGLSAQMTATFGYNQSGENIPDLYQDLLDQQFFNISFQFPLFEWGRGNAEVEAARAEQKRIKNDIALKEEEFNQEVYFQVREFHLLQKQLSIAAKADTIAIRRFEVAKNRYLIGKIDITDLFDAQQAKDAARRQYIQTLRNYWVLFYRLRRLTLYDFENDQPLEYRL
nr:TolC family protein [Calditrichia bacterium]NIV98977.1 TolC family protein [Candidatus Saccharibacteria bacterium]NIW79233.1 TolC family protein [Calditrichia bacterium]